MCGGRCVCHNALVENDALGRECGIESDVVDIANADAWLDVVGCRQEEDATIVETRAYRLPIVGDGVLAFVEIDETVGIDSRLDTAIVVVGRRSSLRLR